MGGGRPKLYDLKGIIHPYVPTIYRQNMKSSLLSLQGIKDRLLIPLNWYKKWTSFFVAYRRLGSEDFNPRTFAQTKAIDTFKNLYQCLHKNDWAGIHKSATQEGEKFYKNLVREHQVPLAHWSCDQVKSSRIVHASAVDGQQMKAYIFQVIVHLETVETVTDKRTGVSQTAEHDRYLVFEKNATDTMTPWRIVGELKPSDVSGRGKVLSKLI